MKIVWKNRAAIALVVMGIVCFYVAARAETFRAFAVVFVLGLLLIFRLFRQVIINKLEKWTKHLQKNG